MKIFKINLRNIFNIRTKVVNGIYYRIKKEYVNLTAEHISLSVPEIFFQHNGQEDFKRYDMIVRLLAVECYFGKNNYGMDFYKRMQEWRMGKLWAQKAVDIFQNLIKSFEENGYDTKSEILLDKNLHLIDGSHRIALAMYFNIPEINAKVINEYQDVFYSIKWFQLNGFTEKECRILEERYKELHDKYKQPFICTLWHPARLFFDEITEKLSLFGKIVEIKDYQFSESEYKFYTRGIYSIDDIAKWKIEKKIEYMLDKPSPVYKIRMVAINIESPDFRIKNLVNNTLSKKCEIIKKTIRSYYKEFVDNYYHDIILHIGDNFKQNAYIYKLLTVPYIDVKGILVHINRFNYVISKTQTHYMPKDFPSHYPLGKDIDIICSDESQYKEIKNILSLESEVYKTYYHIRIIEKKNKDGLEYRTLLRYELEGYLIFQFDIFYEIGDKVSSNFVKQLCKNRIYYNGYFIPDTSYEIMIRISELYDYPNKEQHKKYIKDHLSDIDQKMCDEMLNFDWKKIIDNITTNIQ